MNQSTIDHARAVRNSLEQIFHATSTQRPDTFPRDIWNIVIRYTCEDPRIVDAILTRELDISFEHNGRIQRILLYNTEEIGPVVALRFPGWRRLSGLGREAINYLCDPRSANPQWWPGLARMRTELYANECECGRRISTGMVRWREVMYASQG